MIVITIRIYRRIRTVVSAGKHSITMIRRRIYATAFYLFNFICFFPNSFTGLTFKREEDLPQKQWVLSIDFSPLGDRSFDMSWCILSESVSRIITGAIRSKSNFGYFKVKIMYFLFDRHEYNTRNGEILSWIAFNSFENGHVLFSR